MLPGTAVTQSPKPEQDHGGCSVWDGHRGHSVCDVTRATLSGMVTRGCSVWDGHAGHSEGDCHERLLCVGWSRGPL